MSDSPLTARTEQVAHAERIARDRRQQRMLLGIALMFFAPLAVCFYLYYGHGWRPAGHVNAGELVMPPRPLPLLAVPLIGGGQTRPDFFLHKWTLLYVVDGVCAADCQMRLHDTRQVRLALDRDMNRVQRVLIGDAACCDLRLLRLQHPDLVTLRAGNAAAPLLALLPAANTAANTSGAAPPLSPASAASLVSGVYLIDPLGNLMMFYAAATKPKGMLEDLKRLLRLSSIG